MTDELNLTEAEYAIKMEKAETQMKIARTALFAMIALMAYMISPWHPDIILLGALDEAIAMFFIAMASIVGAYMGFSSWLSKK